MAESDIQSCLVNKGYECFYNVSLGGKIAGLVAIKNNKITVFEFKKHATEISMAIGHCLHYLNDANKVYIVICSKERDLISQSTIDILKKHGIGLIINDHTIEVLVRAKEFEKNNNLAINEIVKNFNNKTNYDREHIKEHLIDVLKKHPDGLSISNISKLTGLNRLTASKYLSIMEAEKTVEFRRIGMTKLFKLKEDLNE